MSPDLTYHHYSNHFLDSNILLNLVIRWNYVDAVSKCKEYMKCCSEKNISERVQIEAETVLNRHRRIASKYLDHFLEQYKQGLVNREDDLRHVNNRFINQYHGQDYPENMPLKRFRQLISALADYFREDFINFIFDPSDDSFNRVKKEIIDETTSAIDTLDDICKRLIRSGNSYHDSLQSMEESLLSLGVHSPDHLILLDCHCLGATYLKDDLAFITSDTGILRLKDEIEKLITNIFIFNP
jgi:hypothetical protein